MTKRAPTHCPFCDPNGNERLSVELENEHGWFARLVEEKVLTGSGIIIPKRHRETPFDLSHVEWAAAYDLLQAAKSLLDERHQPDGYNVGWNCGAVAGQEVSHAHLHVIPRFEDEPLAGKGIRYWIKQPTNRRT